MPDNDKYKNIPGWEIISKGLKDIKKGRKYSIYALAVYIASPSLNNLDLNISYKIEEPNILLYKKLSEKYGNDAHYQYNALMQRITKFCNHVCH